MPTLNSLKVNGLPDVTTWLVMPPAARILLAESSVRAKKVAVPVALTVPSVMAETTTSLPPALLSDGEATVGPDFDPKAYVAIFVQVRPGSALKI